MARITQIERDNAILVGETGETDANGVLQVGDRDSEIAWDEWIQSLKESEASGTITAHRLPVDADGNIVSGKGARYVRWGSWPHNLYTLDALAAKLTKDFLKPGEIAHVRLMGNAQGQRGAMFQRVVTLQRPQTDEPPAGGTGDFAAIMRVMQDGQERQAAMMERVLQPNGVPGISTTARDIMLALIPVAGTVISALVSRPAPKSDISQMIAALAALKDLSGGGGNDNDSDDSTASIIKAVAPLALPLLTALAQTAPAQQTASVQQRIPVAVPVRQVPPTVPVQPMRTAAPPSAGPPSAAPPSAGLPELEKISETDPMLAQLAPQLDQLADLAARGVDPGEVAKLVMEQLPDDEALDDKLYATLSDAVKFDRLLLLSPSLRAHRDWCEALRTALLAEFVEESDEKETKV